MLNLNASLTKAGIRYHTLIPKVLVDMLSQKFAAVKMEDPVYPRGRRIFANGNGNKYTHAWDDAQDIAERATPKVWDAYPHKFRATYASTLLQNGIDLKTVQVLLGHKNLESTQRYLAKAQSAKVREKVDAVFA
jgi:site-specific recombinase XerD